MYRKIYFLAGITALLTGCSRDKHSPDNTAQVYQQLHGKYKVIQATSTEAVDVNLDGTASVNILAEIPELKESNLEIHIVGKDNFLLLQFWPEQYIGHGIEPAGYDPSLPVNYARQGVTRSFSLDATRSQILVHADEVPGPDPVRFPFPASVIIEGEDRVRIVFVKKLYTSTGWKITTITAIYERYTMTT